MKRPGEVTQVRNGMLQVTFCRPDACHSCGACEGGKKEHVIWVRGEAQVGDIAVVDMPDSTVIRASFIAYGMPLVCLLLGLIAGNLLFPGKDLAAALGAAAGLVISLAVLKGTEKYRSGKPGWTPELVDVLAKGEKDEDKGEV